MANIRVLDDLLANKIAAGEVVEKCASVVKELVENSIDAGSDEIKIDLIDAGTKLIRVADNGKGMDKSDATICFLRHATSKLKTEEDLYQIRNSRYAYYKLAKDITLSKYVVWTPIPNFYGVIDGDGKKIIIQSQEGTIEDAPKIGYELAKSVLKEFEK